MKSYKPVVAALLVAACILACLPAATKCSGAEPAPASDDWKKEFDDICSKTQDAMAFSPEELRALIARCDKLQPKIEALDETQKKVYLKRLQRCRDLFSFTLETKENKQS